MKVNRLRYAYGSADYTNAMRSTGLFNMARFRLEKARQYSGTFVAYVCDPTVGVGTFLIPIC